MKDDHRGDAKFRGHSQRKSGERQGRLASVREDPGGRRGRDGPNFGRAPI